jgi:hypothetical protein
MAITAAMMSGNTVSNVLVVDDIEQSAKDLGFVLIEYTADNPAGIGYTYDSNTKKFTAPVITE